ncbi:MAG: YHYH protein [Gemmatimonadaceae bacterium]|nr:YHYH protein [Gemmatimonadaceae bacterium]
MHSIEFLSKHRVVCGLTLLMAAACADKVTSADSTDTTSETASTQPGLQTAKWGANVTVSFANGTMRYRSNGIPNHSRQLQYALPLPGVRVPGAASAYAGADPTQAQSYDFQIPLTPRKAATPTSTSLGTIGVMISGAALFNPYEGDGVTVAMASNFTVKNTAGENIAFLDACNGHPTPMGSYHYHALPPCVTAMVDTAGGPSHIIGVAFDGYLIYGDRDISGRQITSSQLDQCSGITSATPEFPQGVYHYVLLGNANATSSIRCFTGQVSSAAATMPGMVHP